MVVFLLMRLVITPRGLDTQGQRRHVQQQQVRHGLGGVTGEDGGLHCSAVRHGLVGVDGLVQLLSVEEVLQQLLDLGDPGGASDQHDVVDGALFHLGIPHGLLYWLQRALEQVAAELLEPGPGDGGVEVDTLKQGVDLNVGLGGGGQSSLGSLASSPQPPQSSLVALDVFLVLAFELVDKVVHHPVVEVLTSQVSVSGSGLDLEDALLDGQDGDIEGATTKIKDENIALSRTFLLVQPVGNSSGCGLVDDTENVKTGDDSGILGGLPLGVVEVCGDGDDSVLDLGAQVGLGGLFILVRIMEEHSSGVNLLL